MVKKDDIRARVRQLRVREGLRQEDVATKLGVVRAAYAAKEGGRTQFSVTELSVLSDLFKCGIEWILSGKNHEKRDILTDQEARLISAYRAIGKEEQNALILFAMDAVLATKKTTSDSD